MDADIASTLSGFALGEVLSSLDLDASALGAVQSQLGIKRNAALNRDSIYADRFADDGLDDDDDDGDLEDDREDIEALIDREMREEKGAAAAGRAGGAAGAGSAAKGKGKALLRGEEDDFDEDYDGDEGMEDAATVAVKEEPADADDLFSAAPSPAPGLAAARPPPPPLQVEKLAPPPAKKVDVKDLFPSFEPGKTLDFTELFGTRPRKKRRVVTEGVKLALPTLSEVPRGRSSRDALLAPLRPLPPSRDEHVKQLLLQARAESMRESGQAAADDEGSEDEELRKAVERVNRRSKAKWRMPRDDRAFDLAELDEWEDRIVWGELKPAALSSAFPDPLKHRNALFDQGDWVKSILWDGENPARAEYFTKLNLNFNDTQMLLEVQEPKVEAPVKIVPPINALGSAAMLAPRDETLDPFNLSNDREYEVPKEQKRQVIRQTFGALEVVHAYPAQKLQLPFGPITHIHDSLQYKTRLSKEDTRSFHRPALQFPQNVPIQFTKVRSKKKKDKHGRKIKKSEGAEAMRGMQDITLKDTSNFVLWEYSEEHPPIISNVGMGSIIVNYYRKTKPEDTFIPHLEVGQPLLLEGTDESPFKMFGTVNPGQTVTTLYNNLIRAPLFKHQPPETDFLVVRTTIDGETQYFIRSIPHMYVVGQTYPQTEVPGPHSRKVTTLQKNRLMTIAFKLVAKNKDSRIKVHRLTRYFPDHNDLQMRQKLKEFMEFVRKGDNQGFWMIKPSVHVPNELEMLKMAEPETVCLAESMQVGLRTLQDAGYTNGAEEGGAGDDDSKLDTEQQLAPWITTKNFVNANANKAMLKLHGEGDPTGRGEAFSFLRVSMKDIFLRAGETMEERLAEMSNRPKSAHKYNVQEQQDIYKEEIARIWKAQWDALSAAREPLLTQEDEDRHRGRIAAAKKASVKAGAGAASAADTPASASGTPAALRAGTPGSRAGSVDLDDGASVASGRAGGGAAGGATGKAKTLRIKRLVGGVWQTEIVRDPGVIKAYVHQRGVIDEEKLEADELLPSDDESKNERRKKRLKEQLEKLKRNQERRLARKNAKLGIAPGQIGVGGKKNVKTETTRICGNCGQRGHMKTSRKLCPRWAEFNQPKNTDTSAALPTTFGGGLALPPMGAAGASTPKPAKPPKPSKPGALKVKLTGSTPAGAAGSPPAAAPAADSAAATPAPPADAGAQPPPPPGAVPGAAGPAA